MEINKLFSSLQNKFLMEDAKKNALRMLQARPETLEAFEKTYAKASLMGNEEKGIFELNSRQAAERTSKTPFVSAQEAADLTERIVDELLSEMEQKALTDGNMKPVTLEEVNLMPEGLRPQLTGNLMSVDIKESSYIVLLDMLYRFQKTGKEIYYHHFRQGLDILDLDPVVYEMLGKNPNSIGNWFPALKAAADAQEFFKVPETKIVKVPITLLQLTRMDYFSLTPTTLDIVNRWAFQAFGLDENKTYFIKTGTYSSKFDFRNEKVTSPKEVRELGSYLLYIHFQALMMASPLSQPSIYGVSTTNEWCVREYIEDVEGNPCIYHGMPLHTEYRVFIDLDKQEILGIVPYWHPEVMKKRFEKGTDADTADMVHDDVIYRLHEEKLMGRYEENYKKVLDGVRKMLPDIALKGQWSLDVMQNGDDFWLIDMATAHTSALSEYIPKGKIHAAKEDWIPKLDTGKGR